MTKRIRRGDQVLLLAGNEKGKSGKVLSRLGDRVVIEGVNLKKKHLKKTQEAPQGRVVEVEGSVHVSNVALCDQGGKVARVRMKIEKGEKFLVMAKGSKSVVYRPIKKPA